MYISASAVSHTGPRDNNEDNYCFFRQVADADRDSGKVLRRCQTLSQTAFMGVFDGMGGISAGEEASLIAASAASDLMKNCAKPKDTLLQVCETANDQICERMAETRKRMGCTASMLCFRNGRFYLCNLGDSPVFLLRGDRLIRISQEHSERAAFEAEHGKSDPNRKFRLTQYLGIFAQEAELSPYIKSGSYMEGDRFLICSDGLSDVLKRNQIKRILEQDKTMDLIAEQLINQALNKGTKDNVTVICAEITPERTRGLKWLFR